MYRNNSWGKSKTTDDKNVGEIVISFCSGTTIIY